MARKRLGTPAPRLVAWSLFGLSMAVASAAVVVGWRMGEPLNEAFTEPLVMIAFPFVGAAIAARHPRNAIGWIFIAVGSLYALNVLTDRYARLGLLRDPLASELVANPAARPDPLPLAAEASWLALWSWVPSLVALVTFVPLLFPDGRPAVAPVALGGLGGGGRASRWSWCRGRWRPGRSGERTLLGDLDAIDELRWANYPAGGRVRGRRRRRCRRRWSLSPCGSAGRVGVERQQLKWFLFAAVVLVVVAVNASTPTPRRSGCSTWRCRASPWRPGSPSSGIASTTSTWSSTARWCMPCSPGWWSATYVGVVRCWDGCSSPAGCRWRWSRPEWWPSSSSRYAERLQRAVNRLMYGERDDPYTAVSLLGRRLEAAIPGDEVLPSVTETVAQALRVPYAAIELRREDAFEAAARHGQPAAEPRAPRPSCTRARPVGRIVVGPRGPGESFSAADMRLLEDLARAAGVAVHAVRLTADLQRSREHLVVAREEERHRLRRDLHDGLGPTLAGVALQIETVRSLLRDDPDPPDALLAELKGETQAADRQHPHDRLRPATPRARRARTGRCPAGGRDPLRLQRPWPAGLHHRHRRPARLARRRRGRRLPHRPRGDHQRRPARRGHASAPSDVVANDGLDVDVHDDGRGLPHPLADRCRT